MFSDIPIRTLLQAALSLCEGKKGDHCLFDCIDLRSMLYVESLLVCIKTLVLFKSV